MPDLPPSANPTNLTRSARKVEASATDRVPEMERSATLHHDRVFEQHVAPVQLGEVGDAFAEQHRHEADADLVHQAEVERLLDHTGAGDRDVLVAGDLP